MPKHCEGLDGEVSSRFVQQPQPLLLPCLLRQPSGVRVLDLLLRKILVFETVSVTFFLVDME